jgi:glycosyltransferase involved in cell wall biosynthesis
LIRFISIIGILSLPLNPSFELSLLALVSVIVLGIQLLYLLLLLIVFVKKEKPTERMLQAVSVIVCAHDEEPNLRELIPLLLAQDHPDFEVIIVEDRSNDGTFDYLLTATKADPRLKMVRVERKPEHINGKKFGLTLGIKAARHEWLLFTDADCRPASKQWLRRMVSVDDDVKIVLGVSPYRATTGLLNSFIRFEALLTAIQYIGFALLGKPYMGVGRNLAYRKSLFLENKGFNNYLSVMGGDDDLFVNRHATRKNTRVRIGPDVMVESAAKKSWGEFMNQKLRHLAVGQGYKFSDRVMLGLFMISWVAMWLLMPLIWMAELNWIVTVLFVVRWVLLITLCHQAAWRLGTRLEAWKIPILDFIFAFYYLVTGLRALVVKKIRWKS